MPYNPQVTPMAGQFLGQGISQAGEGIASGIKQYQQNKLLAGQATGEIEGALKANPELLQFLNPEQPNPNAPPESVKAFANLQKNGTLPLKDAAVLSQFVRSYSDTKKQQQAQQYQQAQTELAKQQARDAASQVTQRDLDAQLKQRNMTMLESIFNSQNPDSPLGQPDAAAPVIPAHAPTYPKPTARDIMVSIVNGSGQMPDAKTVAEEHAKAVDQWAKVERPLGYVAGGQEKDKEGKDVQNYYPVTIKNDGTILKDKEPLKVYAGTPPPGTLLDGAKYTPIAQPAAQPSPGAVNLAKDAEKEIEESTSDLTTSVDALKRIRELKGLNDQMRAKRWDRTASISGSAIGNAAETAMGDNSGQLFDAKAGALYGGVMKDAKNIRTQREFNAITAEIPKASQTSGTRADLLDSAEQKLQAHIQRLQTASQLMQKGVTPDSAWVQATPQPDSKEKVGDAVKLEQPLTPQIAQDFLRQAGGDKTKAREMARAKGYKF